MHIDRALRLFDSLITSIALYACELWLPFAFTKKSWESPENILNFWEKLKCETLNQKLCRLLLSVHKKTSRLCVLGELGKYPLLITGLSSTLKYAWSIQNSVSDSLLSDTITEMRSFSDQGDDCWLKRVDSLHKLLNIPKLPSYYKESSVGKIITKKLSAKFDRYYLSEINKVKPDAEGIDRSKLRFYRTFKGSFTREPYLDLVRNRNQRKWLTRIRVSSHTLQIEVGRWKIPPIPPSQRFCKYCANNCVDTEAHFLHDCTTFSVKRNCFFAMLNTLVPGFIQMSRTNKISTMLCPTNVRSSKLTNKYIDILFNARNLIDDGTPLLTWN